ncbi:MAG TPA: BMP family protein [Actinomycetota bacterium]|jgi:basic membrane lipoprotein Med (substrate-binding protein (PBP1-ABC) superfamily)
MIGRRRVAWTGASLILLLVLAGAACGNKTTTKSGATGGTAAGALKVGMALPGPKNDKGFNQAHYEGLLAVEKKFGARIAVNENVVDPQARVDALRDLAQDNNVVIGVGAEFAEAGTVVAPQFPKVTFMMINGETSVATNLHVYGIREGVPAYIAGVVAGNLTKSHRTGFVGGEEIPPLTQALNGFRAGVQSVDPSNKISSTVTGSFVDAQKSYAAASSQIAAGADFIYGYVDAGIVGVMEAIKDSGKNVGAFDIFFPRCSDFPQMVGTSVVDSSAFVVAMVNDFVNKSLPTKPRFFGVEDPNVMRFELCPAFDKPDLQQIVKETTDGINSGKIQLPQGV